MSSTKSRKRNSKPGRPKGYITSEATKQKQRDAQLAHHSNRRRTASNASEISVTPSTSIELATTTNQIENAQKVRSIISARDRAAREIRVSENPRLALSSFNDANYKQFIQLTLQKIRGILRSSTTTAGDLEQVSEYADTIYLEDAHVRSVLDSHISSIVGRPLTVADSDSSRPDDQRAVDLVRLCLDNVKNLKATLRALTYGHWSGQAFAEIQWAAVSVTEGNQEMVVRKPYRLIPVHSKKWRIQLVPQPGGDLDEGEYKYVLYDRGRYHESTPKGYLGVDVQETYPNQFIVHAPEAHIRIHERGLWRAAAFKFFQKKAMEQFQDAGAERYAWPFVYAVGRQDMTDESMDMVLSGLQSISQNVSAVFEEGTKIESISIGNPAGAADLFESRINSINADYSKLILGSTLVVEEGDSGSRALAETQSQSKMDRSSLEAEQLAESLREQLVRPILEENAHLFPAGMPQIPTLRFSLGEDTQAPITPDLYKYFRVNEIRKSKGFSELEGELGERFGDAELNVGTSLPGLPGSEPDEEGI